MEQRVYYRPAMKSGLQFQIYVPKDVAEALGIKDRDELEVMLRKTGRKIEKKTMPMHTFGNKKGNVPELSKGPQNAPDEAEKEFVAKYKETEDPVLIDKAVKQFGKERIEFLLKGAQPGP